MTDISFCLQYNSINKLIANKYNISRSLGTFNLWSRDTLICDGSLSTIEKYQRTKQTKKDYLFGNNISTNKLTKAQKYSRLAKGYTLHGNKRVTYASQTETVTNPIPENLVPTGPTSYYMCDGIPPGWTGFFGSEYIVNIVGELLSTDYEGHISQTELKQVIIGTNVTSIGSEAFYDCSINLSSVSIPTSVKLINDSAFKQCHYLTSITIPTSTIDISNYCFEDSNLETLIYDDILYDSYDNFNPIFTNNSGTIGTDAFLNTPFFKSQLINSRFINILNQNAYTEQTSISANNYTTYDASWIATDIARVQIAPIVTKLSESVFQSCSNLKTISFYNIEDSSLNIIGNNAFKDCSNLTMISIPINVSSMGTSCFDSCVNLTTITIPSLITTLQQKCFYMSGLTSISIPSTITSISNEAFRYCHNLALITFVQPSAPIFGTDVFEDICANVVFKLCFNDISLVNQFTTISGSFENTCQDVSAQTTHFKLLGNSQALIDISDDLVATDYTNTSYNISKADISSVVIGIDVSSLGYEVFYNCSNLKSLTIPNSVTLIDASACKQCINLSSITIPDSVTSIGENAFAYCEAATSITIPNSITIINYATFADCNTITSINIPKSITTIKKHGFINCINLTSISFEEVSQLKQLIDGCFAGTKLESIIIPKSVELIDGYVFRDCDSLTYISFEEVSVLQTIGIQAFYQCSLLPSIIIPSSVLSISNEAFYNCQNLTSVIISPDSSLNYIGLSCFQYSHLTRLTYKDIIYYAKEHFMPVFNDNFGTIDSSAFNNTPFADASYSVSIFTSTSNMKFYTLATVIYNTTYQDKIFKSDLSNVEIASTVTSIRSSNNDNSAFKDCSNLTNIIFNNPSKSLLSTIEIYSFSNCTSLVSISFPKTLLTLGQSSFSNCRNLTDISFHDFNNSSLSDIAPLCFSNCTSLVSISLPKTLETLGFNAFNGCSNLSHVIIGATDSSLSLIGDYCFQGSNLTTITYLGVDYNNKGAFEIIWNNSYGTQSLGTDYCAGTPFAQQ
jgi:hypothetical protein